MNHYAAVIKEIGRGAKGARSLPVEDAEGLFADMLDGRVPPLELGAVILSMRIKGESDEELIGFKRALDAHTPQLRLPPGTPRCVLMPTYNGARRQPNLAPLVALLLVRWGVPVLLQGRHDFDSRHSPFELLSRLDIDKAPSVADAERLLAESGLACIGLETLCPALDALLALRPRLGVRNSGHTLAKVIDPCRGASVRVVAVTHPEYLERMHNFLVADGGAALLMRGSEGEAYANPRRRPKLESFIDGRALTLFDVEEGGAPPSDALPAAYASPHADANAACIRAMLAGEVPVPQPVLDQVAALLHLAGAAATLEDARRRLAA